VLLTIAALSCAVACRPGSQDCPRDLPAACPDHPPSYQSEIAPLFARTCTSCHAADASESQRDLSTYAGLYANRGAVLDQVYACNMPPSGASTLDTADRVLLLTWLVCGSPDD